MYYLCYESFVSLRDTVRFDITPLKLKYHQTIMKKAYIIFILAALISGQAASAQEKIGEGLEIDKTVHNFGDILLGSGPVSCTFS